MLVETFVELQVTADQESPRSPVRVSRCFLRVTACSQPLPERGQSRLILSAGIAIRHAQTPTEREAKSSYQIPKANVPSKEVEGG